MVVVLGLVLLAGVGAAGAVWWGLWDRPQDWRSTEAAGVETVRQVFQREAEPPKPVKLDAPTRQLKERLLYARFRPMNPKASGEAIVLNYHDVFAKRGPDTVWYDVTPAEFEAQIGWLRARGANFVSLDRLRDHLTLGAKLPPNPVALTFDDNHQGFYDLIYPVLKRQRIPAAMFVHTDFVGRRTGRARMDWDILRELDRGGLVIIGSHTVSHRDLTSLKQAEQRRELVESKWVLERELGRPILYVAYPEGKADALTFKLAREAGYAMGFTIDWRMPADSPDMLALGRYIQTQIPRAWYEMNPEQRPQVRTGIVEGRLRQTAVRVEYPRVGIRLALIRGGRAESRLSARRESVSDFVRQAGAVAGINGTFFADPYLKAQDNTMVGPIVAGPARRFIPERNPYVLYRIAERPLVAWNAKRIVFVPLKLDMNRLETIRTFIPDYTDVFVGGAWIVHKGRAVWPLKNPPADHWEVRPRVFFGWGGDEVVIGASLQPVSTAVLARAAAAAGVREAVLLDSGYSTSLVYQGQLLAVGRRWEGVPSRPVPHAIVLHGEAEPKLSAAARQTP